MSIFNELLPKINEISNAFTKNFNDDLKAVFECFDKFEEEYGRGRTREKAQKDRNQLTTLQSINEDEDEPNKNTEILLSSDKSNSETNSHSLGENNNERPKRVSKKRSKHEMDDIFSPEQDKRQKRNASVKAQSIISKQVNVNLTQKLRRETSTGKSKAHNQKEDENKENTEPALAVNIKQEKVSLPQEPMDIESLPINVVTKQEIDKDEIAMPPPMAPIRKPRKAAAKEKPEESIEEESSGSRRSTRTRKQTDTVPAPVTRSTRGSSRVTKQLDTEELSPPAETRPKRTRAKKKEPEAPTIDSENSTQIAPETTTSSPAEKPRPKRTRRGKAAEKETPKDVAEPKPILAEPTVQIKSEQISQLEELHSPILTLKEKTKSNLTKAVLKSEAVEKVTEVFSIDETAAQDTQFNETRVLSQPSANIEMDKTVVLTNGVYNHEPVTPSTVWKVNETVVIETNSRETILIEQQEHVILDATVVLNRDSKTNTVMTDDNTSLMTDDNDEPVTPARQQPPLPQPTSAVKEKVQQFEEMASRVTRTKTRAMAKKEKDTETQTPPDKISKPVLSTETLNKMNNMIFNGRPPSATVSSSATKPRANIVTSTKSYVPASTSKLSAINKAKEAAEENMKKEKEDARKKKEAILEAKREQQKRKREEKMAAAAAVREAAERERQAALSAAARERQERQAHADHEKAERLREAERKKQELARKVAETEERRKAEEHARQQRLAEEQRRAEAARKKQLEEAEAMKKEAAIMAKEIEKRQKEYIEKQKLKQRLEKDKLQLQTPGTPGRYAMEPVYMADGFQYLNSDEEEEPVDRPIPLWSTSKARKALLCVQSLVSNSHIDRWFGVRAQTPDLRGIFPNIDRSRLKRTSSAVWRTPPRLQPLPE